MTDAVAEAVEIMIAPPRKHGLLALSVGLMGIGLTVLSVAVILAVRAPRPWNPLGEYPQQTVMSRVDGIKGPATRADDGVRVRGTKCSNVAVRVRGSSFWQSVDVPGTFVATGSGVAERSAGCITQTFLNPVPPAVAQAAASATGPHVWVIAGTETPVRPDGKHEGVPRAWVTEQFEVVP